MQQQQLNSLSSRHLAIAEQREEHEHDGGGAPFGNAWALH
jgi:hypothetical protein